MKKLVIAALLISTPCFAQADRGIAGRMFSGAWEPYSVWCNATGGNASPLVCQSPVVNTLGLMTEGVGLTIDGVSVFKYPASDTTSLAVGGTVLNNQTATGSGNVGVGYNVLSSTTTGTNNTAIGATSCPSVTVGEGNSCFGRLTGNSLVSGVRNAFFGEYSGYRTTGHRNTIVGSFAGYGNVSGSNNTVVGYQVLYNATETYTGSSNILIGTSTEVALPAADTSNYLNIGNLIQGDLSGKFLSIGATANTVPTTNALTVTGTTQTTGLIVTGQPSCIPKIIWQPGNVYTATATGDTYLVGTVFPAGTFQAGDKLRYGATLAISASGESHITSLYAHTATTTSEGVAFLAFASSTTRRSAEVGGSIIFESTTGQVGSHAASIPMGSVSDNAIPASALNVASPIALSFVTKSKLAGAVTLSLTGVQLVLERCQ